jgi:hypothetical protein
MASLQSTNPYLPKKVAPLPAKSNLKLIAGLPVTFAIYYAGEDGSFGAGYVFDKLKVDTPFTTTDIKEARAFLHKLRADHKNAKYDLHQIYSQTYIVTDE